VVHPAELPYCRHQHNPPRMHSQPRIMPVSERTAAHGVPPAPMTNAARLA